MALYIDKNYIPQLLNNFLHCGEGQLLKNFLINDLVDGQSFAYYLLLSLKLLQLCV